MRRGIPFELRPTQWHHMSGAAARQAAAGDGYYAQRAVVNALPVNVLFTVNEDLSSGVFLFRSHPLFRKQQGMDALRRMLCAYLQHNPGGELSCFFRAALRCLQGGILLLVKVCAAVCSLNTVQLQQHCP